MLKCPACGEDNPPRFRLCGYCGAALQAAAALPPRELRKTVTIVFCDLQGSTALTERLDPEAMHEVKARYFAAMAAEITRHGGKIEKYIGDAIMAVFGLPRAHEDDALRAVRAALGMRAALATVNQALDARYGVTLAQRIGVNTGEVVAHDDPAAEQRLATGDAVNVAARLEQAAAADQILIGEPTLRLVRDAVEVEPTAPLALKGKAQPVAAWRLLAAAGHDGIARRHDQPLVGREDELARLAALHREVCERPCSRLVTLIGEAGFGKSRLVREVVDRIAAGARALAGRCLPYGDGITFWPLLTMLRSAAGIGDDDDPDTARARLLAVVGDEEVAQRLASVAGLDPRAHPLAEINWAVRRFFVACAQDGPLVVVIDDIHWAEPAFLDLLEHVQQTAAHAPILLLATARPDLIEERPTWGTQDGAVRIELRALPQDASARLVANLFGAHGVDAAAVARIVQAADGNPLYAEQMLEMLVDDGTLRREADGWVLAGDLSTLAVPPSIHALLEARLDRLSRSERAVAEPAAVIGLEFAQAALAALAPTPVQSALPDHLRALTRKQLIRPVPSPARDLVHRFHHHLVRDTVYTGLFKRARAQLHLAFVRWSDRQQADGDGVAELEEILGYHLEQAHRYLRELGPIDDEGREVALDGAGRLAAAGRRAAARGDMHAAAKLLGRAVALLDPDEPLRAGLLPELGEALIGVGDFGAARDALDEAVVAGDRRGDARLEASGRLLGLLRLLYSGEQPAGWSEEVLRTCEQLIPVLERAGADNELATAWRLVVLVHGIGGRYRLASEAVSRSIAHARRAGNLRLVARNGLVLAINALHGPMPVPQAIAECEQLLDAGLPDLQIEGNVMCALAQLRAMAGELDAARALYRRGRSRLRDLGQGVYAASTGIDVARVELHGGDLEAARREVEADAAFLAATGETYFRSTMMALLARIAREQGRDAEALALSREAEAATADDDKESQALWRMVRAPLLARSGELQMAETLAREAVALVRETESPVLQAEALAELAQVLARAGRAGEARHALAEAIALLEAKGNRVAAARAAAQLRGIEG